MMTDTKNGVTITVKATDDHKDSWNEVMREYQGNFTPVGYKRACENGSPVHAFTLCVCSEVADNMVRAYQNKGMNVEKHPALKVA